LKRSDGDPQVLERAMESFLFELPEILFLDRFSNDSQKFTM